MDDSKTGTEQLKQGKFYDLNTSPASTVLKTADLLVSLGIKRTTLYDWIHKKYLPPPFEKCGKKNHWTVGQIREWRAARALAKTAAAQEQMVEECKATRHYHHRVMNALNSDLDL
ncbi:MAG: hypothetical protein KHX35_10435 [Sutterella wadsworthensis]|nr:hypothetical protein [Sutterella wadsworthensis]